MRLELFLTADYANVSADGKLNVMGIFSEINASSFPARHSSMHLVAILNAELGEFGDTRDLVIKLLDPDGTELLRLNGPITIPIPSGGRTPKNHIILELKDLVFPKPGPYQFVLMIDRDFKGSLPIYLNQVELPSQTGS